MIGVVVIVKRSIIDPKGPYLVSFLEPESLNVKYVDCLGLDDPL